MTALGDPMAHAPVALVPLGVAHLEALRRACAEDDEIWEIYPQSLVGPHFDGSMKRRFELGWTGFAVMVDGEVVGTTNYIDPDRVNGVVEIGGTYIAPRVRGGGVNRVMKRLMIERAFACGYSRIEFRVDTRNTRSMAAVKNWGRCKKGSCVRTA